MSIYPCSEVESDPVLTAMRNYQTLRDNGADLVTVDVAWRLYLAEVEKQMKDKEAA